MRTLCLHVSQNNQAFVHQGQENISSKHAFEIVILEAVRGCVTDYIGNECIASITIEFTDAS